MVFPFNIDGISISHQEFLGMMREIMGEANACFHIIEGVLYPTNIQISNYPAKKIWFFYSKMGDRPRQHHSLSINLNSVYSSTLRILLRDILTH